MYLVGDCSLQKAKGQERGEVGCRNALLVRRNVSSHKRVESLTERRNAYTAGIGVLHIHVFFFLVMDIGCPRKFHVRSSEVK